MSATPRAERITYKSIKGQAEAELIRRYQAGDRSAGDTLLVAHAGFITKMSTRCRGMGVDTEDLIQEGRIGFLEAVEKFDPALGWKLTTYATRGITNPVRHFVANNRSVVRISAYLQQRARRMSRAGELDEASALVTAALHDASIDAPFGDDTGCTLGDMLPAGDSPEEMVAAATGQAASKKRIALALNWLTARERDVISRRYLGDDCETLAEVAESDGCSRQRIHQIETRAMRKLRRCFGAAEGI